VPAYARPAPGAVDSGEQMLVSVDGEEDLDGCDEEAAQVDAAGPQAESSALARANAEWGGAADGERGRVACGRLVYGFAGCAASTASCPPRRSPRVRPPASADDGDYDAADEAELEEQADEGDALTAATPARLAVVTPVQQAASASSKRVGVATAHVEPPTGRPNTRATVSAVAAASASTSAITTALTRKQIAEDFEPAVPLDDGAYYVDSDDVEVCLTDSESSSDDDAKTRGSDSDAELGGPEGPPQPPLLHRLNGDRGANAVAESAAGGARASGELTSADSTATAATAGSGRSFCGHPSGRAVAIAGAPPRVDRSKRTRGGLSGAKRPPPAAPVAAHTDAGATGGAQTAAKRRKGVAARVVADAMVQTSPVRVLPLVLTRHTATSPAAESAAVPDDERSQRTAPPEFMQLQPPTVTAPFVPAAIAASPRPCTAAAAVGMDATADSYQLYLPSELDARPALEADTPPPSQDACDSDDVLPASAAVAAAPIRSHSYSGAQRHAEGSSIETGGASGSSGGHEEGDDCRVTTAVAAASGPISSVTLLRQHAAAASALMLASERVGAPRRTLAGGVACAVASAASQRTF
jgi:hypothetical protein